jgi:hypothetical protein
VVADGLLAGKSGDLLSCLIHKGNFAFIVSCEYTIGNAIENHIKEFIGLSSFHLKNHTIKSF